MPNQFKNGKKEGLWSYSSHHRWAGGGRCSSKLQGYYKDGKKEGVWTYVSDGWDEQSGIIVSDDSQKSFLYKNGILQDSSVKQGFVTAIQYDGSEYICNYFNGLLLGEEKTIYNGRLLSLTNWIISNDHLDERSLKHGRFIKYYKNGNKKEEGKYELDQKVGLHTVWYENGNKKQEGYWISKKELREKSHKTGVHTTWYENGNKKEEGEYRSYGSYNHQVNVHTTWYENGNKESEFFYVGDDDWEFSEKKGPYTLWYENGNKKEEGEYIDERAYIKGTWFENKKKHKTIVRSGNLSRHQTWNEHGELVSSIEFSGETYKHGTAITKNSQGDKTVEEYYLGSILTQKIYNKDGTLMDDWRNKGVDHLIKGLEKEKKRGRFKF